MTVDLYQPAAAPALPVVAEMDSWIAVCSDVIKVANVICDTPFVPDGLRGSGPAVAAAILAGRELSLGPMTSLANIHVIKGKPALSAVLMRALVLAQGHQWEDVEVTDTRAVIRGKRRGEAEWTTVTFTADQAKKAQIDLGKYPQDKLYARATSRLARRKFADVIAGMPYSAEELEDGPGDMVLADDPDAADRAAANSNGQASAAKPAARTARRRTAQAPAGPGTASRRAEGAAGTEAGPESPAAPEGPPQPPLPGEDETESAASPGHVGLIVQHFERLGFTDRGVRLGMAAMIAGREQLASTKDLTEAEAKKVLDTLARCKDAERLTAVLDGIEGGQEGAAS
jgi:hypothetical protein